MNTIAVIRRALATATLLIAAAVIAGCGGVGAGGTGPGTAAVGAITGFGSIHVNGIEFDDAAADIRSDDGSRVDRGALDLGMWVEVLGAINGGGTSGRADAIRVVRAVRGAVTRVEPLRSEFRVLGAQVQVNAATVFSGMNNGTALDGLRIGDVVDVYGALDDRNNRILATRVQRAAAGAPVQYIQRGRIDALTPSTFVLGGLTVNYATALIDAPRGLAEDLRVTVIAAAPPLAGVLVAVRVIAVPELPSDEFDVALDGVVYRFDSSASFRIDDTRIDASQAVVIGGSRNDIVLGARLFVRGTVVQGLLVAREVIVLDATAPRPAIALGPITTFTSVSDFQVRSTRVDASAATFIGGTAASLAVGRIVEARGSIVNGVLRATRVVIAP